MKRMKTKLMMLTMIGMLAAASVPISANAQVPDNVDMSVIDEDESTEDETQAIEEMGPLTPDGNLSIVDDYGATEQSGKQFITVTTKDGNIFYIIIDRDDNGENTVHFLNLVDEQDLMALLDDDEKKALEEAKEAAEATKVDATKTDTTDSEKDDNEPVKPAKKSGKSNVLVICILIGMAGVGGLYFYSNKGSFIKKKKGPIIDDDEEYIEIPSESEDKDYEDVPVE